LTQWIDLYLGHMGISTLDEIQSSILQTELEILKRDTVRYFKLRHNIEISTMDKWILQLWTQYRFQSQTQLEISKYMYREFKLGHNGDFNAKCLFFPLEHLGDAKF